MKKTFFWGVVASMLVASCSEEDGLNQGVSDGITFSSVVGSRATDTSFEANDEIGISMYANGAVAGSTTNVKYATADGSSFTSQTPITWGLAGGADEADFVGVYPYKADGVVDGAYTVTLSTEGGALSKNDVMYARTTSEVGKKNVNLIFRHKLVKVVMQVYDENGKGLAGADVKIDKQQTTGTLDLSDGTVTVTGDASAELAFATNPDITGQYQTIVMPSDALQGRCITISYNGKDYPCPIDAYVFESGKRITFSATISPNGTVSPGQTTDVSADVTDWDDEVVDSGWIFAEGEEFEVTGKNSRQLAADVALSNVPVEIGGFEGDLLATDVYSLEYTRESGENTAAISVSGKVYTLPAGQTSGTILIAVGENVNGISVSSEDAGITLTKVLVYTNERIVAPILLWEGDGTVGNGAADMGVWPPKLAEFTIGEADRGELVVGATVQIHYTTLGTLNISNGPGFYSNNNFGENDEENKVVSTVVTLPLYEAIVNSDYKVTVATDWEGKAVISKVELVPSTEEGISGNLLWWTGVDVYMTWGRIDMWLPASLAEGDIIRVNCKDVSEGAKLKGAKISWGAAGEEQDVVLAEQTPSVGAATVDFKIDAATLSTLTEKIGVGTALTLVGENLAVTSIELVRAGAAQ